MFNYVVVSQQRLQRDQMRWWYFVFLGGKCRAEAEDGQIFKRRYLLQTTWMRWSSKTWIESCLNLFKHPQSCLLDILRFTYTEDLNLIDLFTYIKSYDIHFIIISNFILRIFIWIKKYAVIQKVLDIKT